MNKNSEDEVIDEYGTIKMFWFHSGRQPSRWQADSEFRINCSIAIVGIVITLLLLLPVILEI